MIRRNADLVLAPWYERLAAAQSGIAYPTRK